MFPSVAMLEVYRIAERQQDAHLDDLLTHMGQPVAFISRQAADHLSSADLQLAKLLTGCNQTERQSWLEQQFAHARCQRIAAQSQAKAELTRVRRTGAGRGSRAGSEQRGKGFAESTGNVWSLSATVLLCSRTWRPSA